MIPSISSFIFFFLKHTLLDVIVGCDNKHWTEGLKGHAALVTLMQVFVLEVLVTIQCLYRSCWPHQVPKRRLQAHRLLGSTSSFPHRWKPTFCSTNMDCKLQSVVYTFKRPRDAHAPSDKIIAFVPRMGIDCFKWRFWFILPIHCINQLSQPGRGANDTSWDFRQTALTNTPHGLLVTMFGKG